jgi:hypothetical protein
MDRVITGYNQQEIGACIARLGDHRVYRYGEDEVIKFSQFDWCRTADDLVAYYQSEISVLMEAFGAYMVPTQVVVSANRKRVALLQPLIEGTPLRKTDLHDAAVARQLQVVVTALHATQKDGEYIDLVGGGKNFFAAALGNIFITSDGCLQIIDVTVLRTKDFWVLVRPVVWLIICFGRAIQKQRIERLFER